MRILPYTLLLSFVLVSLGFYLFPQVDLWVSGLFYRSDEGFYLGANPLVLFSYKMIPVLTTIISAALIGLLIYTWIKGRKVLSLDKKAYAYLLLVLLIGPGLLSSVFKDNWHRARPITIEQFGGQSSFSPAYVISDQCDNNCSFFSGHPTTLYFFIAVALVAPPAYRRRFMLLAISGGLLVGLGRIIQGGHFFSDIIISGFMVAITAYLMHWLMYRKQNT